MADDEKTAGEQEAKDGENGTAQGEGSGMSEKLSDMVGDSNGKSMLSALKSKEVLVPAAISAAGAVAASKGPALIRKLAEGIEDRGEQGAQKLGQDALKGAGEAMSGGGGLKGVVGKAASKAAGKGKEGDGGGEKTRRLPIERWTDVAVPIDKAYQAWLKFDQYPRFMHRVQNVERKGSDRVQWQEKIWFSSRDWEGQITDQRENDRIAWKTKSGMSHRGVVSFHRLSDNLTRVMVTMEFVPNGIVEKMASGLRFVKRAVQADLARFKAYVEMEDASGVEYRPKAQQEGKGDDGDGEDKEQKSSEELDASRRERQDRRDERKRETAGAK